ncbi:MAG: hypothetical protein LPD71_06720 [Shewanella sp.]|nr:hypothetical protein [Shewanella sp.]MCF1459168.1 hypothetical protein [Shewanella sp.]
MTAWQQWVPGLYCRIAILSHHNKLAAYTWYRVPGATDIQGSHYDFAGTMELNAINGTLPTNDDFYICGPVGFMAHVKAQLTAMDVADAQKFLDRTKASDYQ